METVATVGAKKSTLENLEGLGARRLAELLLEFGEEDAEIKRRLRLELAGEAGAEVIAADITKRLAALRRARSFIDWQKRRSFVKDIDLQREMIATKVAEGRPDLALDLMWRFMDLAEPILNRVDDSYGDVGDVFRQACRDLGAIAGKAMPDPIQLADRVFQAVTTNDYGEYDQLVHVVFSALKEPGVARLKSRLVTALAERPKTNEHYDSETGALKRALQDTSPTAKAMSTRTWRTRARPAASCRKWPLKSPPACSLPEERKKRMRSWKRVHRSLAGRGRLIGSWPGSRPCLRPTDATRPRASAGAASSTGSMPATFAPT